MGDILEFQDFQNELDNEGIIEDDETEEDELSGAGMHVEGEIVEDEEIPEMEKDL